jgi:MFS family permease
MSLSEDPDHSAAGHTRRPDGGVDIRPTAWILGTGCALVIAGLLIALVSPYSSSTWSWQKVGFLLVALGLFVFTTVLGALEVLGHPWGVATRRTTKQRFRHPRLAALVLVWMGIWAPSLLVATLFPNVAVLLVFALVVLFLGFPLLVIGLFGERKT